MAKKIFDYLIKNFTFFLLIILLLAFWQRQCEYNSYLKREIKNEMKKYTQLKDEMLNYIDTIKSKLEALDKDIQLINLAFDKSEEQLSELKKELNISYDSINTKDFVSVEVANKYLKLINEYEKEKLILLDKIGLYKNKINLLTNKYEYEHKLRLQAEQSLKKILKISKKIKYKFGVMVGGFVNPNGNVSLGLGIGYNIIRF